MRLGSGLQLGSACGSARLAARLGLACGSACGVRLGSAQLAARSSRLDCGAARLARSVPLFVARLHAARVGIRHAPLAREELDVDDRVGLLRGLIMTRAWAARACHRCGRGKEQSISTVGGENRARKIREAMWAREIGRSRRLGRWVARATECQRAQEGRPRIQERDRAG